MRKETESNICNAYSVETMSANARRFVDSPPPFWVRTGTYMVFLMLTVLGYVIYDVHYPQYIESEGIIRQILTDKDSCMVIEVSYPETNAEYIHVGQNMLVSSYNSPRKRIPVIIDSISDIMILKDGKKNFSSYTNIGVESCIVERLVTGMRIHVLLQIGEKPVWNLFFLTEKWE